MIINFTKKEIESLYTHLHHITTSIDSKKFKLTKKNKELLKFYKIDKWDFLINLSQACSKINESSFKSNLSKEQRTKLREGNR